MQLDDEDLVSPLSGDLDRHRAEANVTPEPEDDPYAALEAQFKAATDERDQARAEAAAEKARAEQLHNRVVQHETSEVQNHQALIEQALVVTQTAIDAAKERYRQARMSGDIEEELQASEHLQDAREELRQLRQGREQIAEAAKRPPASAPTGGDPVEAYIDANFPIERDREWIRAHKNDIFGKDDSRKQLAILGDQAANLRGFKPGTDAYYAFLDAHMGYEASEAEDTLPPAPKAAIPVTPVKAKRPAGAPSARVGGGNAGGAEAASPEITALARDLGMSPAKYMEYQKGLAEGKYPGYRLLK
jgi:hypothetical protein